MEYRYLGNTGISVSAISLGCEGFMNQTPEEVKKHFDYAISKGINFIDIYSPNPDLRTNIGKALKGRREDFIIQGHLCTVWTDGQYLRTRETEQIMPAFEAQLKELDTDYLDIGMIHYVDSEEDFNLVFNGEIIKIAQKLKKRRPYTSHRHEQPQSGHCPQGGGDWFDRSAYVLHQSGIRHAACREGYLFHVRERDLRAVAHQYRS